RIISSKYEEFENVLVAPSKGNLLRNVNPDDIPYEYGRQYTVNSFYPSELGSLRSPYIVRDYRAQTVLIQPIQYNPVTKVLRVYYDITLELFENGTSNINIISNDNPITTIDESFNDIYAHHFLNYDNITSRYTPVEEMGNMLIISYADFMDEMQPFIDWKIKSGTAVEIVDVATIGGTYDIEQYIENYYNDNGLTYVLLVGDAAQVPTSNAGGNDSDVKYSYIVGSDHYPDLFIGRFSAETEAHVVTQVTRVLNYEQNPISEPGWYSEIIGVASNQGPGDDNEYDYQHNRNINTTLLDFTYTSAYEFYDGSQGGNDATGNPTPSMVSDALNTGASIINYTGHGSEFAWSTSGFSNSHVNNLTNNGKLPFIFSVACVNGNFVDFTCFAEAWMRAENNGEPTGAIATFMSTINQSWNPPMRGQDEMNDIISEIYSDNIKRTFGGIAMNGCMNMNDVYGSAGDEMTDTWTIFGDPSLEIRTAAPQVMMVTHADSLFLGASSMNITCDADGALATLSMNGEILGSVTVEGGAATITFDELGTIGTMDFVVTAFNYIPYISTIDAVPAGGTFIYYATNLINDITGNNDGLMDYSEDILLTVGLMNVGVDDAIGVTATISTTSEYIELITTEATYGNILANDTVSVIDGFQFIVSDDIPDEIIANFVITATDINGEIWESSFMLTGHSPELVFYGYEIYDPDGNINGKIEPGETVTIFVDILNEGSSEAYGVMCELLTSNQYVTINDDIIPVGNIAPSVGGTASFSVTAAGGTPEGTFVNFEVNFMADNNINGSGWLGTGIGQKPVLILDLSHSSSMDSMVACFTELQVGNDVANDLTSDMGDYQSVFVLLGVFPNNYALDAMEGDLLAAYLEDGGRVYMEGGDAWFFDTQTTAHELFNIDGVADGADDLGIILGEEDGILEGYSFEYDGANNYIDHIAPKLGSVLLFSNDSPEYGIGVSFENEIYKTIGTSFEFAGLVDQEGSTKDGVMAEILYFFGINYLWTGIDNNVIDNIDVLAYPNPASDIVTIEIEMDSSNEISLGIIDLTGRKIADISKEENLEQGTHSFTWNTSGVEAGIYLYKITIGNNSVTRKIVVNK
ncbi:MAG: C25 family cysteine peptidase, partial [Bacteroidota bacterium]